MNGIGEIPSIVVLMTTMSYCLMLHMCICRPSNTLMFAIMKQLLNYYCCYGYNHISIHTCVCTVAIDYKFYTLFFSALIDVTMVVFFHRLCLYNPFCYKCKTAKMPLIMLIKHCLGLF